MSDEIEDMIQTRKSLIEEYNLYERKTYLSKKNAQCMYPSYTCQCKHCKENDLLRRTEIKGDLKLD